MATLQEFLEAMGPDPMAIAKTLEKAKIKGRAFDEDRNCPVRKYLRKKVKVSITEIVITPDNVVLFDSEREIARATMPYSIFWFLQMFDADFFGKKLYMK